MVSPYLEHKTRDYTLAEAEIMKKRRELTLRMLRLRRGRPSVRYEERRKLRINAAARL